MQISSLTSEFRLGSLMLLGSALKCYFLKVALMFIVPAWSLLGLAVPECFSCGAFVLKQCPSPYL